MAAEARDLPAWYGKMSSLGDFASRRLDPSWQQRFDHWLAHSMSASVDQLGARWLEVYLTAPVWRFALAPGVLDPRWWFGVLMPSCDNVGRYFPLLLVQARDRAPADRIALDHLELWWRHLAAAALQTLSEDASLDGFEAALQQTPPWPGAGLLAAAPGRQDGPRERLMVPAGWTMAQALHGLAARDLQTRLAGCSLWSRAVEAGQEASFSVTRGLPDASSFAELLAGTW